MENIANSIRHTLLKAGSRLDGKCRVCGTGVPAKMITICDKCNYEYERKTNTELEEMNVFILKNKSNLPKALKTANIDSIEDNVSQKECVDYINKYIRTETDWSGPYLFGKAGTGKTLLGSCLLNKIIHEFQIESKFINMAEFLIEYRGEKLNSRFLFELLVTDVLLIDDLGNHNISKFTTEIIYSILNKRLEHKKTTIITSNFSPLRFSELLEVNGINKELSLSIRDRLLALCDPIKVDGDNIRYEKNMLRLKK